MQRGQVCYPEGKRQSQRLKPGVLSGAGRGVGREAVRAAAGRRGQSRQRRGLGLRSGGGVRPPERS